MLEKTEANEEYHIYVRCNPCYMCKDAFEYAVEEDHKSFCVQYGKYYGDVKQEDKQVYDAMAQTAYLYSKRSQKNSK